MQAGALERDLPFYPFLFPVFVDMMSNMEVGLKNREELTAWATEMYGTEVAMNVAEMPTILMEKMHDQTKIKAVVDLRHCGTRRATLHLAAKQ
eukprot:1310565-Lingulodinium_polyedra.AAC.1